MNKNKGKIVVAMSGGVDSSVAAALLKSQGYDVIGVFMKFWKPKTAGDKASNRCCTPESEKMARLVAKKLSIPFYVLNFEKEFKKRVVDYFLEENKAGKTPNPCVVCNKYIKFGLLLEKAFELGANAIATGHYAQIGQGEGYRLLKGSDKDKDQSYFLWQLSQKQLKHVLFPVGGYTKSKVRELAKKFKLPFEKVSESQEICFIDKEVNDFLKRYLKIKSGDIVDGNSNVIGQHQGLWFHTIGQRKGMGIAATKPYYVSGKNIKKNLLVAVQDKKALLSRRLTAEKVNWLSSLKPKLPLKVNVRIRYRSPECAAVIYQKGSGVCTMEFAKPQRAVTPGQSVVFYSGKELLGGGIIKSYE